MSTPDAATLAAVCTVVLWLFYETMFGGHDE